jgi:hypothetical protein
MKRLSFTISALALAAACTDNEAYATPTGTVHQPVSMQSREIARQQDFDSFDDLVVNCFSKLPDPIGVNARQTMDYLRKTNKQVLTSEQQASISLAMNATSDCVRGAWRPQLDWGAYLRFNPATDKIEYKLIPLDSK